jgi:hypothetical protein
MSDKIAAISKDDAHKILDAPDGNQTICKLLDDAGPEKANRLNVMQQLVDGTADNKGAKDFWGFKKDYYELEPYLSGTPTGGQFLELGKEHPYKAEVLKGVTERFSAPDKDGKSYLEYSSCFD